MNLAGHDLNIVVPTRYCNQAFFVTETSGRHLIALFHFVFLLCMYLNSERGRLLLEWKKVTSTLQSPVENMELRTSYCNKKSLSGNFQKCTTCISMMYLAFLHTMYTHIRAMMFDCWGHRCCPCQLIRIPTLLNELFCARVLS